MESHWESHGLNPKIQKYAARFFTTNSPKKLKSKNPKYPKSQIPKKQSLERSQNKKKNKLWKCAPSSSWGNSEHISKLLFVAGLAPNIVHRTRTSVQAEHVHRTCSGGVWPNKRSDKPNKCSNGLGTFTFKQNYAQRNPNKRSDNPNMFSRTRSDSNTEQNTKHEQVFSNTRTAFSSGPGKLTPIILS